MTIFIATVKYIMDRVFCQYGKKESSAASGGCSVRQGRRQVEAVTLDPSSLSLRRDKVYYFKTTLPAVMRTA